MYNASTGVLSANITVTNLGSAPALTAGSLIGSLSEDGKTLTITTNHATEKFDGKYAINIAADAIATKADKDVLLAEYNGTVTVADTTSPAISKVEYSVDAANAGKYKATVTFSEPLASEGTVSLNGSAITGAAYTFVAGGKTIVVNNLDAGTQYALAVTGALDKAGNLVSPNPATATLTIAGDEVKPTVAISAKGSKITFKFSEKLGEQDLDANPEGAGSEEHAKFTINGGAAKYLQATDLDQTDATGTTYVYDATGDIAGSFLNASVKVESFKDLAGNAGNAATQSLTISKDTAAPKFVSASVVDNKFIVKFDEDAEPNSLTTVGIKYTNVDNVVVTKATAALDATVGAVAGSYDVNNNGTIEGDEENYIVLPIDATETDFVSGGKLKAGSYEVTLAAGTVEDKVPNATTTTIKFTASATGSASKAIVELDAGATDEVNPGVIEAVFNKDMSSTALVAANYKLDNVAIPAASKLYFNTDKQHVTIELPKGFVTVSGNRALTVANLTDVDGNTLKTGFTKDTIDLTENVAPVATGASLVDDNNVNVTFGENLGAAPSTGVELWVNNAKVTLATTPFAVSDNVLTITTDAAVLLKPTDTIVVKFVDGIDLADANGNVVAPASVTVR
ncbi:hypothetical protein [Brevibacillus nitrificans]|uniref:hypothetical protein n=1 Tax=Brevibacillus nitrificans TaxID=651560 RepID=UPI00261D6392|nr:hypothetical protein [Brevibacillus nitrificans]